MQIDSFEGQRPSCDIVEIRDERWRRGDQKLWAIVGRICGCSSRWSCMLFHFIHVHGIGCCRMVSKFAVSHSTTFVHFIIFITTCRASEVLLRKLELAQFIASIRIYTVNCFYFAQVRPRRRRSATEAQAIVHRDAGLCWDEFGPNKFHKGLRKRQRCRSTVRRQRKSFGGCWFRSSSRESRSYVWDSLRIHSVANFEGSIGVP